MAAPTPFTRAGELDTESLAKVLAQFVAEGAHVVFVAGGTGEWYDQS